MGLFRKLNGVVHMNCKQASEMYSRSMDGRLPAKEKVRFSIHYMACAPCRFYVSQLKWLRSALRIYREKLFSGAMPPPRKLSEEARRDIAQAVSNAADHRS